MTATSVCRSSMLLSHYDYDLPEELIAQEPLSCRSDARLLVVDRQKRSIQHRYIRNLPDFLNQDDCIVLNDTKVIPARLVGERTKTGGRWEGLFLQCVPPTLCWQLMGKTRGIIQIGETVRLHSPDGNETLLIEFIQQNEDATWLVRPLLDGIQESVTALPTSLSFDILDRIGRVPIPPYIRQGVTQPYDRERYQTVYALRSGSVAAPTAGLHFTPELLQSLKQDGIKTASITLHVGMGTFKPMTVEKIENHVMHSEWCSVSEESAAIISSCRKKGGRILAIGTTSMRVLESAPEPFQAFEKETSLFIRPPYVFRNVDGLLTNFHFPKSSLLVLVRTFGNDELIQKAYEEAIREKYRFFSYGDAMLIV